MGFLGEVLNSRDRPNVGCYNVSVVVIACETGICIQGHGAPVGVFAVGVTSCGCFFPFPCWAPATMHSCNNIFSKALARATTTPFLFTFPSHTMNSPYRYCRMTPFADAAPCKARFRVGLVRWAGIYKHELCPKWVKTLQQAELYACIVL